MTEKAGDMAGSPMGSTDEGDGFLGCNLPPDTDLAAEGWMWRCNTDANRQREIVDTYTELGFEVHLRPVDVDAMCEACDGCKVVMAAVNAVYVRKKPSAA